MIDTKEDHEDALAEIEWLMSFDPERDTVVGRYLEKLVAEVEAYENEHYPIGEE